MEHDGVTVDDLIQDLLVSLGDKKEPRAEDGWFTLRQMLDAAQGATEAQLRRSLRKGIESGTHERMVYSNTMYYRKVKGDKPA